MFNIKIVHKTGRTTDFSAVTTPEIVAGVYVFKLSNDNYVNIPVDSVEIMTMVRMEVV